MTRIRTLLIPGIALAALPLASCLSFGGKPPPTLLSLSPEVSLAAGATQRAGDARSIAVFVPFVPQSLTTVRIPVQVSPNEIAYLTNAQWIDAPPKLFRNLLAETIAVKTGHVVLDQRSYALAPGARLAGTLELFGLDAATQSVVVRYDAELLRKTGATLETRRFEARQPAAAQDGPTVAAALNRAANQVASDVAEWVK